VLCSDLARDQRGVHCEGDQSSGAAAEESCKAEQEGMRSSHCEVQKWPSKPELVKVEE
jgi:hypothetical protein